MKYYVLAKSEPSMPLKEVLLLIKESGFEGVFFNLEYDDIKFEEIDLCRKLNLDIETLHLPYGNSTEKINLLWKADDEAMYTIDEYKKYIDFAANNNIKTVIMHASNGFNPPKPNPKGLKYFEIIADYCEKKNVILAIENIKSIEHVSYILENLKQKCVKLCFDIGHANAFTKNLDSNIWNKLFLKLHCVHLHDNSGEKDEHLLPGMGTIDWDYWKKKISSFMNSSHFTFEIHYNGREEYYKNISHRDFYKYAAKKIREMLEK